MSQTKTLLISHFYNEEFLLPFWIKQHINMFDEVVMIDYDSTDSSVEIIRQLAPHWQIRKSRNKYFLPDPIDQEVMDIEREFGGYWKMALNTTEFIVMRELNLKSFLETFVQKNPDVNCIASTGAMMADAPENVGKSVDPNIPLFVQRHYGSIEWGGSRNRILHRVEHGHYSTGRHDSALPRLYPKDELYCLWYGWSPYCEEFKKRKMQIQNKIPASDIPDKPEGHYVPTVEILDNWFKDRQVRCYDLLTNPGFNSIFQTCPKSF